MVGRRDVVGGSLLGGLAALVVPRATDAAAAADQGGDNDRAAAAAIDRLRESLERQAGACELGQCAAIATIRNQQRVFLRANRKYPDYIDAGLEAWEAVYDWHVKNRQEVRAARLPDGRYGVQFMFTTVVLREDQTPGFIGWGYDAR